MQSIKQQNKITYNKNNITIEINKSKKYIFPFNEDNYYINNIVYKDFSFNIDKQISSNEKKYIKLLFDIYDILNLDESSLLTIIKNISICFIAYIKLSIENEELKNTNFRLKSDNKNFKLQLDNDNDILEEQIEKLQFINEELKYENNKLKEDVELKYKYNLSLPIEIY